MDINYDYPDCVDAWHGFFDRQSDTLIHFSKVPIPNHVAAARMMLQMIAVRQKVWSFLRQYT